MAVPHVADKGPATSISGVVRYKSQTLAKRAHKKGRMSGLLEKVANDGYVEVSKPIPETPIKLGAVYLGPLELPLEPLLCLMQRLLGSETTILQRVVHTV